MTEMLFFDPRVKSTPAPFTHNPLAALIAPRPVAWVSTMNRSGGLNLAPFSHFNLVSVDPPMLVFAPNSKDGERTPKDTFRNLQEVPEFVVSVVSGPQCHAMNLTSSVLSYGTSEFEAAGIAPAPSVNVRPPRVADSKAALECKIWQIVDLPVGKSGRQSHMVIGSVVGIHVDPTIVVNGRIDPRRLEQVARLGYYDYLVVRDVFEMKRPDRAE